MYLLDLNLLLEYLHLVGCCSSTRRFPRCYGCKQLLKPGGNIQYPPEDMVVTTRLCCRYYDKDGQPKISPKISSVYFHLKSNCVCAACPQFETKSCVVPNNLIPLMFVQHSNALSEQFRISAGTRTLQYNH